MSRTIGDLRAMQALDLNTKIRLTQARIRQWVNEFDEEGVVISFSGGKDSTVLLHLVREMYPDIKAVFVDVPTQYPELKDFVKTFPNVDIIKPKVNFFQVCSQYGFPLISKEVSGAVCEAKKYLTQLSDMSDNLTRQDKTRQDKTRLTCYKSFSKVFGIPPQNRQDLNYRNLKMGIIPSNIKVLSEAGVRVLAMGGIVPHKEKGKLTNEYSLRYDFSRFQFLLDAPFNVSNKCCDVMKKDPLHEYLKKTKLKSFTGQMAEESLLRETKWIRHGCNAFTSKFPTSNPMSFWTEQDVLKFIKENGIEICSVYGKVVSDSEEAFQMNLTDFGIDGAIAEEKLHCTGCQRTGCVCCGFGAQCRNDKRFLLLKETHPKMYNFLDIANNNGYTMRQAIEWMNAHGKLHIYL